MSQNSLVVANGTGANVRAAVNNALDTLVTLNSGTSAPSTTVAYMLWADTTTGMLKIRNAANSAWITVGTLASTNLGMLALAGGTLTGALVQAVGANVASASTINLTAVAGNACHITGTTTITAVTLATGKFCEVIFDAALTLTHHATNNNLPGAANITTAAGDRALYWSDGTTVYCLRYTRADGTAVVKSGSAVKLLEISRDMTAASGAVSTAHGGTGTPKLAIFFANREGGGDQSWGVSDGSSNYVVRITNGNVSNVKTTTAIWLTSTTDSDNQAATATFSATDLTLTWTKTGSPTGTAEIVVALLF